MDSTHMFTFGPDQHPVRDAFVYIAGVDAEQARDIMLALYGTAWAFQYSDPQQQRDLIGKYPMQCVRRVVVAPEFGTPVQVRTVEDPDVDHQSSFRADRWDGAQWQPLTRGSR